MTHRLCNFVAAIALGCVPALAQDAKPVAIRVATYNLEDVRPDDIGQGNQPRLRQLAETIQRVRPNIILLNEIAFGAPDDYGREGTGSWTAEQFNDQYLAVAQRQGLEPMRYKVFTARPNTGMPSGFDLDHDGQAKTTFPLPTPSDAQGRPPAQTESGKAYGNDCWGFGTFPGEYGMALLVDERLEIVSDDIRTFRLFPWRAMPNANIPKDENGELWYPQDVLDLFRLSSKSHWDVPVKLPNGTVVHLLCSHPTPPTFDGDEMRNRLRNHDEIRFWADYIMNADYIVDDDQQRGGLDPNAPFVILGDLNADPDEGNAYQNPVERFLLQNKRVNASAVPASDLNVEGLDPDDTSTFGLRVDYVLPSDGLRPLRSGIWRTELTPQPSDHYLVWMEIAVPGK